MWAQSWANIGDFSLPYPGKTNVDISDELVKQVIMQLQLCLLDGTLFLL